MAGFLFSLACVALAFGLAGAYLSKETGPAAVANLILAGILIVTAAVLSVVSVQRSRVGLSRRALARALLQAGIAVAVTAGVLLAASRITHEWDLTEPRLYTLSEYSQRVMQDLPLDIDALYAGNPAASGQERILIERFAQASERFRLKIVAPQELAPEIVRQLEQGGSQLVLYGAGRARKVPAISERAIIQTVLAFTMRATTQLCFLSAHGEPSLEENGPGGLSSFRNLLAYEGFQATELLLASQPDVPKECDIVVIAAPEREFLPAERDRLRSFVNRGGRLLVFSEPDRPLEPGEMLQGLGISALRAVVVDEAASLFGSEARGTEPIVNRFTTHHPIAQGLTERTGVVFSGARPLLLRGPDPKGFVYSGRTSRYETTGGEGLGEGTLGPDMQYSWMRSDSGSYPLAASRDWQVEGEKEARVVVFGDLDFATNRLLGALYNEDLLMNSVYYLANREDEVVIRPKAEDLYQAPLIPEKTFAAFHSIALLIPEAILILGLVAWFRRRRL
jgi:hypothetical protein